MADDLDDLRDPKLESLIRAVAGVAAEVTRWPSWIAVVCATPADRDRAAAVLLATGAFREAEGRREYAADEGEPAASCAYFEPVPGVAPDPRGPLPN